MGNDYFEFLIIDWDTESYIGIRRGSEYEYAILEEYDLLQTMLQHGVPYEEIGDRP